MNSWKETGEVSGDISSSTLGTFKSLESSVNKEQLIAVTPPKHVAADMKTLYNELEDVVESGVTTYKSLLVISPPFSITDMLSGAFSNSETGETSDREGSVSTFLNGLYSRGVNSEPLGETVSSLWGS